MHIIKKGLRFDLVGFESDEITHDVQLDILECLINEDEMLLLKRVNPSKILLTLQFFSRDQRHMI